MRVIPILRCIHSRLSSTRCLLRDKAEAEYDAADTTAGRSAVPGGDAAETTAGGSAVPGGDAAETTAGGSAVPGGQKVLTAER